MLSRVWKESAPGPFVDPFNDFTSWNDGRFLAERGTPDRFAYPPNTSTPNFLAIPLLSWARKKESNASLISLFSSSRILAIPSKRIRDAKLSTISRKKKEETIESWKRDESDFSKTKNSWPDLRKKSRTNQFSPESILREFRGNDKNCMERPLSGRRRGRREKTKKKKKKKKEKMKKRKKKRQSIFER